MQSDDPAVRAHQRHMTMRGLSPQTISHRGHVLARLASALDGIPLLRATAGDLARWRESLTVSNETAAGYISHVRAFYAWAVADGRIKASPAASLPVPRTARRIPRPIAEADLMEALDAAPRRIRPWLVLAAWCGLRAKEIALLRGENILLGAVPPVLIIASDATKGRRERTVPLSTFAVAELARAAFPPRGLIFRNRIDGRPLRPWLISKLCNRHLHECGIPATLHQLRHRFGTQAYHVSKDLRAVQELMGHASPMATAGYAAYDRAEAAQAVEAIPVPPAVSF